MNKEHIKQLAKEFCEAEGLQKDQIIYFGSKWYKAHEFMQKFLESLIEKAEVVDRLTYDQQSEVSKMRRLEIEVLKSTPAKAISNEQALSKANSITDTPTEQSWFLEGVKLMREQLTK